MKFTLALALSALGAAAMAQGFTSAAEVKPILQATKANWVALRDYDGNDLLYFTHLESWRCGLTEVRFSINSGAATQVRAMEPCYEGTAQPNALKLDGHLPYIVLPQGMTKTVAIVVVYDDGSEDRAEFERGAILLP